MASKVKLLTHDIKSKERVALLTDIVKHAFSSLALNERYKETTGDGKFNEVIKLESFRLELVSFINMQMKRGNLGQYVAIIGQDYTLQVKYSKTSMAKFDILGFVLLLYEIPYITVATLLQKEKVTDEDMEKIKSKT